MLAVTKEICRTLREALATWPHTLRLCLIGVVVAVVVAVL